MHPIKFFCEGVTYEAEYDFVGDDSIIVYLPDGTTRETWLRGLDPESAAKVHLKAYAQTLRKKKGSAAANT